MRSSPIHVHWIFSATYFGFLYCCWPRLLILYNKIIRSENESSGTVEGDLRLQGQTGTLCCQPETDQEPLEVGTQPQTVPFCFPPALPHSLRCHPLQFLNFPILWEGSRCGTPVSSFERILTSLLLQSRRPPAPPLPAASPSSGGELGD